MRIVTKYAPAVSVGDVIGGWLKESGVPVLMAGALTVSDVEKDLDPEIGQTFRFTWTRESTGSDGLKSSAHPSFTRFLIIET